MKFKLKALALAAVTSASPLIFADEVASEHSFSGNIGLLSSYNLRGNTALPENDKLTIQGGLDYSHTSGLYAGWWTSTLDGDDAYPGQSNAMEHDFYVGYNGSFNDDLGFTVGTTYYYYYDINTSDANGFELLLGLNYKDFGVTAQTLLEDTIWGNAGDTYFKATYSYPLPNFIRSAIEPLMMATVIMAKVIWKMTKRISGIVPESASVVMPDSINLSKLPIKALPSPNAKV